MSGTYGKNYEALYVLKAVGSDYQLSAISSPQELYEYSGNPDVLLLDVELSERYATDPLMDHIKKSSFPLDDLGAPSNRLHRFSCAGLSLPAVGISEPVYPYS